MNKKIVFQEIFWTYILIYEQRIVFHDIFWTYLLIY